MPTTTILPRRFALLLAVMITLVAWGTQLASAQTRVALVVGNGDYQDLGPLANPPNDAALMATTLRGLGFEVIVSTDVDQRAMKQAIKTFGRRLEAAGSDSVGLFYYAGHGIQVDGINYLIPIGAEIEHETDVDIEAVDLDWVLNQMEFAANRLNFLIIDACRNNPVVRSFRSGTRGLAQVDAPRGTLIAYATEPGGVAADGAEVNSPYTGALVKNLKEPGRVAEEVFRQVRVEVLEATDEKQVPWESSSLTGAFYFNETGREADEAVASVKSDETGNASESETGNPPEHHDDVSATDVESEAVASTDGEEPPALFDAKRSQGAESEPGDLAALGPDQLDSNSELMAAAPDDIDVHPLALTLYVQERANLRGHPSADSARLTTLDAGVQVRVTGEVADRDWYRVAVAEDGRAFIWKPLLGEQKPETSYAAPAPIAASSTEGKAIDGGAAVEVVAVETPIAAVDTSITRRQADDLTGRWQGEYRCQGDIVGFSVDLEDGQDGQLNGVFEFYPVSRSPFVPRGSYAVSGQVRADDGLVQLWGTDWIDRPVGFQQHDLEGRLNSDGKAMSGQILTVGCTEFVLSRN